MARETRQEMILEESKKPHALVSPPTTDYKLEHATITLERLIQNKRGFVKVKTGFKDLLQLFRYYIWRRPR